MQHRIENCIPRAALFCPLPRAHAPSLHTNPTIVGLNSAQCLVWLFSMKVSSFLFFFQSAVGVDGGDVHGILMAHRSPSHDDDYEITIHSFIPPHRPPSLYLFIHSFIHSSDDAIYIIIIITYVTIQYNTIMMLTCFYMYCIRRLVRWSQTIITCCCCCNLLEIRNTETVDVTCCIQLYGKKRNNKYIRHSLRKRKEAGAKRSLRVRKETYQAVPSVCCAVLGYSSINEDRLIMSATRHSVVRGLKSVEWGNKVLYISKQQTFNRWSE